MTPQTRLDLLADEVLERLHPLSFAPARTRGEVDAVLRMRYASVVEEGWADPEDFPHGRERDEYDDGATFVVCREADELVGSARLVPPVPGRRALIEKELDVRLETPEQALEAGRLVVPRRHRLGRSHRIMAGLFARGWLLARELGFDRIVGQADARLVELYRGLGLRVTVLGPSRRYFAAERYPIEVAGAEGALAAAWLDAPRDEAPGTSTVTRAEH